MGKGINIQTRQSKKGLVETYKAISRRNGGIRHTIIMAKVLETYVSNNEYKALLDKSLERDYDDNGRFITCPVSDSLRSKIHEMSGDGSISAFVVHRLLKYLEINSLDANNPPSKETQITLKHRCF